MRHTDVIRGFTPDIVRTESLYVPGKTPVEAMTTEELFRGMCFKSQKMISARIAELKKDGYPIGSRMDKVKNRWGETCRVKRYYLEEGKEGDPS